MKIIVKLCEFSVKLLYKACKFRYNELIMNIKEDKLCDLK